MICLHREDAKLRSIYDLSQVVCIVCLVENMTDKKKHMNERLEYGRACLDILSQQPSKSSTLNKNNELFFTAFEALWSKLLFVLPILDLYLVEKDDSVSLLKNSTSLIISKHF